EGEPERQADLRQVQGHPPARSRDGDLRQPPPQAAPGL
ncbi:MAG: LSU ribosomal protein L36p @ LSU ribosomal protein L36p, zinc-dependent, partial [uncultured Nocardioidaceae bacterium]